MNIKNIISVILDDEDKVISDSTLLSFVRHFANEFIIDLCVRNGRFNCLDLKDVSVDMEKDVIVVNIPEYIKKYMSKTINKKEIVVKFILE